MRPNLKVFALLMILASSTSFHAQVEDRPRPDGWDELVYGGRFMDRFLPIPIQGKLTAQTWGADVVVPRYTDNGLEDNINSYWGGNALKGDDGKYHLFVAGWPEIAPKGHMYWPKSTVYHAIAETSFGPYKVRRAIGPGHNPTLFKSRTGQYVIYVIDGYYISDDLNGPWELKAFDFNPRDRDIIEGLSNFTFAQREDGSYLAVCRGGGIWLSETGQSSYNQVTQQRVYPKVEGRFEDPLVWKTNVQYHLIVNDWLGRIAWYMRSKDGVHWKLDTGEAYLPGISVYEDGTKEDWFKYERIRVLQDEYGRATQAHFAVIDTLKHEDKPYDNHSSKHTIIPLTVGKLISVLNTKLLTDKTKTIEVKIKAEEGFNPHTDIDFSSLRFGAPQVIDFGGGSKLERTQKAGNDLVLIFDGAENGFTPENFAGKLLGKTTDGKLLFGYSKLPEISYIEPILSARKPILVKNGKRLEVEVQNFGQVASENSEIRIITETNGKTKTISRGKLKKLQPFEKTNIQLKVSSHGFNLIDKEVTVIIASKKGEPVIFKTEIDPKS